MPKFRYSVRDKEARLFTGVLEGRDKQFVVRELKKKNLTIISVLEEKQVTAKKGQGKEKVNPMDLVVFSRQLATLIDAGVSLVMGLNILREQVDNPYLKVIIASIKSDIEAGNSLSNSFAKYPNAFPEIFMNMTRAGESSGSLNEILERVADYLERTESVRRKLVSSLTYPALIVGMAVLVVAFLMLKVVPTFKSIFESLGGKLPLPTLILIKISNYSLKFFPFIVVAIILFYAGFMKFIRSEQGRLKFDQFKLKLPIFGPVLRNISISKFTRTLATLVKSGVNILEAFEISGKVSGNKVIEQATNQIKVNLQAGENISGPMEQTGKFPVFVVKMIAIGEQTGQLEKMLNKVSEYYEEQISETLGSLTSLLEPFIIVFLGVIIGYIVLAMFMPIFKLSQAMGH